MPRMRAKVQCFVGEGLREKGDEFDYNGPENSNLELVKKPKRKEAPVENGDDPFEKGSEDFSEFD